MDKIVSKVELDMEELQPRIGQGGQVCQKKVFFVFFYCLFVWLVLEARFLKICSVCLSVCLLGGFSTFSKCESFEATKSPAFLESSFSLECKFLSSHR